MCNGVVIDANSIKLYFEERILNGGGAIVDQVHEFLGDGFIYMDVGRMIEQEWLDCSSFAKHAAQNLADWIADHQQSGKIRLGEFKADAAKTKRLRALGLRKKDLKYLLAADQFGAYAVVSNDSDLFDPQLKAQHPKTREKAMARRNGPVCKYARRQLQVEVTRIEDLIVNVPRCENQAGEC